MKRLLFIYNPTAGRGILKQHLFEIIRIFAENGFDTIAHPTLGKLDAFNAAEAVAADVELIAVAGGDGTFGEVIRGLTSAKKKIPLGLLPAGTMNDFASCHGISKNLEEAAFIAVTGTPKLYDIGYFKPDDEDTAQSGGEYTAGDYFTYVAAFGAFTNVSYETSTQMKNIFGVLAYLGKGIAAIGSIKSTHMTITHDGEVYEDDFIFGMAANSTSVGGMKGVTGEDVSLNDGLFECVFIRAVPPSQIAALLGTVMSLDFSSPFVLSFKTEKLTIKAREPLSFTLDGERGGCFCNVTMECIKEAIEVIGA